MFSLVFSLPINLSKVAQKSRAELFLLIQNVKNARKVKSSCILCPNRVKYERFSVLK